MRKKKNKKDFFDSDEYKQYCKGETGRTLTKLMYGKTTNELKKGFLDYKNAERLNRKLRHEWWKIPLIGVVGIVIGIITPTASESLKLWAKKQGLLEQTEINIGKNSNQSNQKDTVKTH